MRASNTWRALTGAVVLSAMFGYWVHARAMQAPTPPDAAPALPMELFGTMGKERKLVPGEEMVLFEQAGAGTLTHMWFGGSWPGWGDTRIRVYVDGEAEAGIDMALFLGHGVGWGDDAAPWGTHRMGKTGHPSGVYNTYRIPFGKGVKVTARLTPGVNEPKDFWWIVRGLTHYPVQLGGITLPTAARLRLHRKEAQHCGIALFSGVFTMERRP
jgi:hypothetical protein